MGPPLCAGIQHQIHYLNDFLFMHGSPSIQRKHPEHWLWPSGCCSNCESQWLFKTEGPAYCITFLGILIDTNAFELRLPVGKIQSLQILLQSWSSKKSCTRKELESLLRHLSHVASVVRIGCTFLRQLFSLLNLARAPHHFIRLNLGARETWHGKSVSSRGSTFFPLPTLLGLDELCLKLPVLCYGSNSWKCNYSGTSHNGPSHERTTSL